MQDAVGIGLAIAFLAALEIFVRYDVAQAEPASAAPAPSRAKNPAG
jgi:hypothetical protein